MNSDQEDRKLHKHKKIRKDSRDRSHKKDKKDKHSKKEHRQKRDSRDRQDRRGRDRQQEREKVPKQSYDDRQQQQRQMVPKQQKVFVPRTHIPCRRCENQTFSLKLKQCSNCGYPKEQRPANFPQTKQIDVMQLIRSGKLTHNSYAPVLIQVVVNDRMGRKNRIKCGPDDTIFDLKKLVAAQIGTRPQKIRLQKSSVIYKDHLTLADYQIKDGMGLEMYYD